MLPGVYHCNGGRGPDLFDDLAALEDWVERGIKPDRMSAYRMPPSRERNYISERKGLKETHKALMSRPLCPYPQVARYAGTGNPNDAASFSCAAP